MKIYKPWLRIGGHDEDGYLHSVALTFSFFSEYTDAKKALNTKLSNLKKCADDISIVSFGIKTISVKESYKK